MANNLPNEITQAQIDAVAIEDRDFDFKIGVQNNRMLGDFWRARIPIQFAPNMFRLRPMPFIETVEVDRRPPPTNVVPDSRTKMPLDLSAFMQNVLTAKTLSRTYITDTGYMLDMISRGHASISQQGIVTIHVTEDFNRVPERIRRMCKDWAGFLRLAADYPLGDTGLQYYFIKHLDFILFGEDRPYLVQMQPIRLNEHEYFPTSGDVGAWLTSTNLWNFLVTPVGNLTEGDKIRLLYSMSVLFFGNDLVNTRDNDQRVLSATERSVAYTPPLAKDFKITHEIFADRGIENGTINTIMYSFLGMLSLLVPEEDDDESEEED